MADAIRRASAIQYVANAADIQPALNKGGHVYVEAGSYTIDPLIGKVTNTKFEIAPDATLTLAANSDAPMITDDNVALTDITFCGPGTIDGNSANQGGAYPLIWAQNAGSHRWRIQGGLNLKGNNKAVVGGERGGTAFDVAGNDCKAEGCFFYDVRYGIYNVGQRCSVIGNHFIGTYIGMALQGIDSVSEANIMSNIGHVGIYLYQQTKSIGDSINGGAGSGIGVEYDTGDCQIIGANVRNMDGPPIWIGQSNIATRSRVTIIGPILELGTGAYTQGGISLVDGGFDIAYSDIVIMGGSVQGFTYGVEERFTGTSSTARCVLVGTNLQGNVTDPYNLTLANWDIGHLGGT